MKVVVYQKYSVANKVGTVMVGMVIDGKVTVGTERSVVVIEGSVIDGGGIDDLEGQTTTPLEIAQ